MDNQKYLKVAVNSAKQSSKTFIKSFGKVQNIFKKNGDFRDLVTEADRSIETQIRKIIYKNFPSHKIIGEELGSHQIKKNDLIWIIDPIDGTTNYIHGLPACCISIALWDKKGPLVAALYAPILDQLFTAVKGQGAKLNGEPIVVSKTRQLYKALGGLGWFKVENAVDLFSKMAKKSRKLRVLATAALQTCLVGAGNYDFQITKDIKIWDFAAAILIVTEAGGKVTDIKGEPVSIETDSIIASNGKIHKELLSAVR